MNALDQMRVDMEPHAQIKKVLTPVPVHQKLFQIQIRTSNVLASSLVRPTMTALEMPYVIHRNVVFVQNPMLETTADVRHIQSLILFYNYLNLIYK